jgi:porin
MIHAETRYGEDVNRAAGVLAFPNANMLYPLPGENETAVTGFLLMQALNEKIALTLGKFNGLDLFNMLYPNTGRGIDGFMNISFLLPPSLFRTTGQSFNGAGVLGMHGQQIQSAFLVYDTNSTPTTVAPDLFDKGAVFLGYHRFFTEIGCLPGSHGFLANYSNRTYASTDPLDWAMIPGEGLAAVEEEGSWTLAYLLDQMLWVDECNENRNVRLFSIWSLADGNPNPYRWTGNVQLQGTGLISSRPADTMGVGYFYDGLSSEFKTLVSAAPMLDIEDVHGFELYYNAAITPWFHLTGDLQVVDNQNVGDDPAIILGLRAKINL